jgi:ABC-type molybdate transport system ATPase subunit
VPVIYVTHDRDELHHLAEHVIVLDRGQVVKSGPPAVVLGG